MKLTISLWVDFSVDEIAAVCGVTETNGTG